MSRHKSTIKEKDLLKWLLDSFRDHPNILLKRRNVGAHKTEDGRFIRFGEKGQADIWGIVREHTCSKCKRLCQGTHLEIELKGSDGMPTELQIKWLNQVAEYNAIPILLFAEADDPINLQKRVEETIYSTKCPICYGLEKNNG